MDKKGYVLRIFIYEATCICYVFQYHIIDDKAMVILKRLLKNAHLSRHVGITPILRRCDVHNAAKPPRPKANGQGLKAKGRELRQKYQRKQHMENHGSGIGYRPGT
jgi:hypothetical protein